MPTKKKPTTTTPTAVPMASPLPGDVRAVENRRTKGGNRGDTGVAGGGSGLDLTGLPDPGSAGGAGGDGRRKPYTAQERADMRKQQEQLLKDHLAGPWTTESILGQYNGTVASVLGNQHPKAEQFARFGMEQKMDAGTFGQWLRNRPEFLETEGYRKAKGDYLSVLAEVFGYR